MASILQTLCPSRAKAAALAPGRRVYFGLFRDAFRRLTPEGLQLWDAAVTWALE